MIYNNVTFTEKLHNICPQGDFQLCNFTGIKKPIDIVCNKCSTLWHFQAADKIIDRHRRGLQDICRKCEDTAQRKPREQALKKLNTLLPTLSFEPVHPIKATHKKVLWKCNKCEKTFLRTPGNILSGHALLCPHCEGRVAHFTFEELQQKAFEIWGTDYSILNKNNETDGAHLLVRHNKCGFIWKTRQNNFLRGHGCPRCKQSTGEYQIERWLKKHHIPFKIQEHLILEKETHLMTFDFYIEYKGQKIAIEYNGKQHYQPIDFFGGEAAFLQQQTRDKIKLDYCERHGIELIVIPYNTQKNILTANLAQRLGGQVTEDQLSLWDKNIVLSYTKM